MQYIIKKSVILSQYYKINNLISLKISRIFAGPILFSPNYKTLGKEITLTFIILGNMSVKMIDRYT